MILPKGELYTYVTKMDSKGKKGALVASIKGTRSVDIIDVLQKIPLEKRKLLEEITLDMANKREHASRMSFPQAILTTDHFHIIKLAMEAMQHVRIKYRWEQLDKENKAIKASKDQEIKYVPIVFNNDDTPKKLLARSRYMIAKKRNEWTANQEQRIDQQI